MVSITDAAGAHLHEMLSRHSFGGDIAIRLLQDGGRLVLRTDRAQPRDQVFQHEGRTVLVVDRRLVESLGDRTLEVHRRKSGDTLALVG